MDDLLHRPSADVLHNIAGFPQRRRWNLRAPILSHVTSSHAGDITLNLPTEIMAEWFAFLSFRDLIFASHVSSHWRAAAVAFPPLWANIYLFSSSGRSDNLLSLAMSRAGQLPVDIELAPSLNQPASLNLTMVVEENRLRIRSIRNFQISLDNQAPLLQEFDNVKTSCWISSDFLGGVAGRLRTLRLGETCFLDSGTCPALSTVTHLRASCPWFLQQPPHFERIFALCPQLGILDLHRIWSDPRIQLPAGTFPPTLKVVKLHALAGYDLVRMYNGWAQGVRLPQVQLEMPLTSEYNLAPFLEGALDIVVTFEREHKARVVADLPNACRHTLALYGLSKVFEPAGLLAKIFRDMAPATLGQVRSMRVPLSVLDPVLAATLFFPTVTRLEVDMFVHDAHDTMGYEWGETFPNFRWKTLDCLPAVPQCFPAVTALELVLHREDSLDRPTLEDARELLQYVSARSAGAFPLARVHGFPAGVVRAVSVEAPTHPWVPFADDDTLL